MGIVQEHNPFKFAGSPWQWYPKQEYEKIYLDIWLGSLGKKINFLKSYK
jgi:hypothetical protein